MHRRSNPVSLTRVIAISRESTEDAERAASKEGTIGAERAVVSESTVRSERAVAAEGTVDEERAEVNEGTESRERAARTEGTERRERAADEEGTEDGERADPSKSTVADERAVAADSTEDIERAGVSESTVVLERVVRDEGTDELERGGGTAVLDPVAPSVDEIPSTGNGDADFSGWFCIATNPFPCPTPGCPFVALFATAAHHIIVFSERDDDRLLDLAGIMKSKGRNPRVVSYEASLGPCMTYDQWEALNRPVHGIRR